MKIQEQQPYVVLHKDTVIIPRKVLKLSKPLPHKKKKGNVIDTYA